MMPDAGGIGHRVRRLLNTLPSDQHSIPELYFLDMHPQDSAATTLLAVEKMVAMGVGAIIALGGDGTHRLVARVSGQVPFTALSSGTNNVFAELREATIAGLATGLVATRSIPMPEVIRSNKVLKIETDGNHDLALVDICVSSAPWAGAKALWRSEDLEQLFVTFAESDVIGLSSIAGLIRPVSRHASHGLILELTTPSEACLKVLAPIAPGLFLPVGVTGVHEMQPGKAYHVRTRKGIIALDGEREIEFSDRDDVIIRLDLEGPRTIRIRRVMEYAARKGLLTHGCIPIQMKESRSCI